MKKLLIILLACFLAGCVKPKTEVTVDQNTHLATEEETQNPTNSCDFDINRYMGLSTGPDIAYDLVYEYVDGDLSPDTYDIIKSIINYADEYLDGKMNLIDFQNNLETAYTNYPVDMYSPSNPNNMISSTSSTTKSITREIAKGWDISKDIEMLINITKSKENDSDIYQLIKIIILRNRLAYASGIDLIGADNFNNFESLVLMQQHSSDPRPSEKLESVIITIPGEINAWDTGQYGVNDLRTSINSLTTIEFEEDNYSYYLEDVKNLTYLITLEQSFENNNINVFVGNVPNNTYNKDSLSIQFEKHDILISEQAMITYAAYLTCKFD